MPRSLISLLIQVACMVHIVRTGRDRIWLWIVFIPLFGPLAYLFFEILPGFWRSYRVQKVSHHAVRTLDPERDARRQAATLDIADTVENRRLLAEEYVRLGRFDEAAAIYRQALSGIYSDDVALLMGLARAASALGNNAEALDALDRLRAANPKFQSNEAHLIYAKSLDGLGRYSEAMEEYAVLVNRAPGEETRCRYAMLLSRQGHQLEARELYNEILTRTRRASRQYRRTEKEWIDIARRSLNST